MLLLPPLNSSLLPSFILRCFLSSFLCPLCFLCHCSFRTGFVPWVSSSGFVLQPLFIESKTLATFEKCSRKPSLIDKTNCTFDSAEFRGHQALLSSRRTYSRLQFNKFTRDKVSLNTRHTSLNCGSACFCLQWFSASILHTTIVIYGNYPSLGSSINWLLLGDGSSCCLVGGSSTVRGNAGEFKRRHLWGKEETVLFC